MDPVFIGTLGFELIAISRRMTWYRSFKFCMTFDYQVVFVMSTLSLHLHSVPRFWITRLPWMRGTDKAGWIIDHANNAPHQPLMSTKNPFLLLVVMTIVCYIPRTNSDISWQ
jgi:hypothetical protein